MFTGIVEETGKIQNITSDKIVVECETVLEGTKLGESIALNGVCLTVVNLTKNFFEADVSQETFRVSALGGLKRGDFVNLERAMAANGRFGGHMVSGHIDGVGKLISARKVGDFYDVSVEIAQDLAKYVVKKGSIAINGISLTIADVKNGMINLAIIPHTYENTNLKYLKSGSFVNIEVDIIAKYVENFLSTSDNKTGVNLNLLQENGFL